MIKNDDELYNKLKESYTENNLHKISHNLIRLYREKQFDKLHVIAERVSEGKHLGSISDKQGFSRLISIFHPDRIQFYQNELEKYKNNKDQLILRQLEPILLILDIEEFVSDIENYEDIDYAPEFMWDIDPEYFTYFDSGKKKGVKRKSKKEKKGCSFYDAMKIRFNGDIDIDYPFYYLENMDEIEIAESNVNNLDGVEYCINTINMDLSGNSIFDLTPLFGLKHLSELNLSDNKIFDIDVLATLPKLKSLNLTNNPVQDLTPLLEIDSLEYLDITRTQASFQLLKQLEKKGVIVNFSD
jgi:Leucine-rich repeat (LRR) protein